ncbi:MAG: fumarylacetoacetate hydrolase family protein [Planctomycetota bacterium]
MRIGKFKNHDGLLFVGLVQDQEVVVLGELAKEPQLFSKILHAANPEHEVEIRATSSAKKIPLASVNFLVPMDQQEVWAAGVTYLRSREARERESEGAAKFYDLVYKAQRPELFFKSIPAKVASFGQKVRIRKDSKWSVPEPELTLVVSPVGKIVGFTIGNDMSARDIEGENPLYLPQAKMYSGACAIGPVVTLAKFLPQGEACSIHLQIHRAGVQVFEGKTSLASMARKLEDLVSWLFKENDFPEGAFLLTGTGVVPPDQFTLLSGDVIKIEIAGIGVLENTVE